MDSDELLEQAIIDELAANGNLDRSTIAVSVKNGIVHLFGTLRTDADRDEARAKVKGVRGVREVHDDLNVLREVI